MGVFDHSESYISAQLKHIKQADRTDYDRRAGNPFVTVSRESGAYGTTFAGMLAEYLQDHDRRTACPWTVFDKNLIKKVIEEHHFPERFEPFFSERASPEITDALESFMGVHPSKETLVHRMSETILHLAHLGHAIIVGRGANIITRSLPKGVHVRLTGSLEKRIRHMQEYMQLNEKQAREYVLKEAHERRDFIRKYFDKDITDVLLYDVVVNTDTMPLPEAVRMVGELVLHGMCKEESQRLQETE